MAGHGWFQKLEEKLMGKETVLRVSTTKADSNAPQKSSASKILIPN
jgi:hypothetical protein